MNYLPLKRNYILMGVKRMNRTSHIGVFIDVIKQAIKDNKYAYLIYMFIGSLVGIEMFYFLKLTEETTNASYLVFTDQTVSLLDALEPVIMILIVLLSFQIVKNIHYAKNIMVIIIIMKIN